jgi:taurine dioxygenase
MNPILSEHLAEGVKLDVFKLSPHIGTEVRGLDLSRPLDVTTINALHTIWLDRALLIFRRQKLDQEALVRFTRYFGQAGERTASTNTSYAKKHIVPEIMLISNVRENGEPIGALPDGDTCFASGYAAYDTLDPNVKAKLEGKRVCNTYQYGTTKRGDLTGALNYVDHSLHPAFRTHEETGRKAIYVNRLMSVKVDGMDENKSEKLLNAVFDHAEKDEFVYCHKWSVGDLLMWDNRSSMHARTDFPSDQRRVMWRTQILGTHKPF